MARVLNFPHGTDGDASAPDEPRAEEEARLRAERLRSEAEILARVVAGDVDAFEYFVRTYQKRITRFVFTLLRDPSEADCVAQDVFVKAFRALPEFKRESAFETWATRIAINTVRDRIRRRRPVVSFSELRAISTTTTGPRSRRRSTPRTEPLPRGTSCPATSAGASPRRSSRCRRASARSSS